MLYLLSELLIYLIAAAVIGFILGWLERGKRGLGDLEGRVKREAQNTRNEHSALNNKIATLEAKLDKAQRDVAEAQAATGRAGRDGDALRADLLKARTEIEAIRGEVDAAESRAGSLQGEAAEARARAETAEQALNDARAHIARLEKERDQARQSATEAAAGQDDITGLEADLEAAQIELAAARAAMEGALSPTAAPVAPAAKPRKPAAKPSPKAEPKAAKPKVAKPVDDDLKEIKGIGPVLEKKLKALGITSYAQIAKMDEADLARINEQLNFKDRHVRDDWKGRAVKAHEAKYGSQP